MAPPSESMIPIIFLVLSNSPNDTYGMSANASRKPKRKPLMCAQLSIHGNSPRRKRKMMKPTILRMAIIGRFSICTFCNTSTKRQAKIPNCAPAGPTWKITRWDVCRHNSGLFYMSQQLTNMILLIDTLFFLINDPLVPILKINIIIIREYELLAIYMGNCSPNTPSHFPEQIYIFRSAVR